MPLGQLVKSFMKGDWASIKFEMFPNEQLLAESE